MCVVHYLPFSSSICIEDQKLSIMALSSPSPTVPDDGLVQRIGSVH
ncbi:hypothetical protein BH09ACT12_BH09ACT12_10740 [soil metagenome]